jgi:hypothetical protein
VIPLGPDDRAPANAIAHGSWSALGPLLFHTRPLIAALDLAATAVAGAEHLHARALSEQQFVAESVAAMADGLAKLGRRLDALETSQADRRQLDAASEAARELLEIPNSPETDLSAPAARDEVEQGPHGDLAAVKPATQPEDQEELEAGEREDQGDLPRARAQATMSLNAA